MMHKNERKQQSLLEYTPRYGYLPLEQPMCPAMEWSARQPVSGIVAVITDHEHIICTIYNIGIDGVSFYCDASLDTSLGIAINMDIMMYEPLIGLECYIADEQGLIVNCERTAEWQKDKSFLHNVLFPMLSPRHENMIKRYLDITR